MTMAGVNPMSPAASQGVSAPGGQMDSAAHKKLAKAAQEFEGMLISQLLGDFNAGLSSLSGDSPLAGSDSLNALAVQTLSTAMASRGGFGIGRMLVHQLEPSLHREK